jgi:5-methyltetrahydropteroyltriglutamate--homocysteine methyltransferase
VFDLLIKDIVDLVLSVDVGAYSFEAANPRQEHEWKVWKDVSLPAGKVLMPGLIAHSADVVEHPQPCGRALAALCRQRHGRHRL